MKRFFSSIFSKKKKPLGKQPHSEAWVFHRIVSALRDPSKDPHSAVFTAPEEMKEEGPSDAGDDIKETTVPGPATIPAAPQQQQEEAIITTATIEREGYLDGKSVVSLSSLNSSEHQGKTPGPAPPPSMETSSQDSSSPNNSQHRRLNWYHKSQLQDREPRPTETSSQDSSSSDLPTSHTASVEAAQGKEDCKGVGKEEQDREARPTETSPQAARGTEENNTKMGKEEQAKKQRVELERLERLKEELLRMNEKNAALTNKLHQAEEQVSRLTVKLQEKAEEKKRLRRENTTWKLRWVFQRGQMRGLEKQHREETASLQKSVQEATSVFKIGKTKLGQRLSSQNPPPESCQRGLRSRRSLKPVTRQTLRELCRSRYQPRPPTAQGLPRSFPRWRPTQKLPKMVSTPDRPDFGLRTLCFVDLGLLDYALGYPSDTDFGIPP